MDFRKKYLNFFMKLLPNISKKNILLVTHEGIGIYARWYFEGELDYGDYSSYKIKNFQVVKYKI